MGTTVLSYLNWLHIIVATIAYFALGAIWYSLLFGKKWVAYHNIDVNKPDAKKGMATTMLGSFILEFVIVAAIDFLAIRLGYGTLSEGLKLGLFTGICFSATTISITYLYLQKPLALHFIENFYHIIGQLIAALILCAWH